MESEQGLVAFFDSANAAYQKAVRVGEEVAGFTVKDITAGGVQLSAGERTLGLRVNQQLRRSDGGEWRVTGRDLTRVDAAPPASEASAAAAAPAVPANASDVLRRLMEQRQKQLKQ
jgi:hypothetical protein